MRKWSFVADMNRDHGLTISDVWLWVGWGYLYPGDLILWVFIGTGVGNFFEITSHSYGGLGSGLISFFIWIMVAGWISAAFYWISNLGSAVHQEGVAGLRRRTWQANAERRERELRADQKKPVWARRLPWWVGPIVWLLGLGAPAVVLLLN